MESSPSRILTFPITEEYHGRTVKDYLREKLHFSGRQISSLKYREDGIRVNDEMSRVSRVLKKGDILTIVPKTSGSLYLDHGSFTGPPDILFEDEDLLIVNKPSGMVCHPSPGHYADSLANQAAAYAASKNENWTIRLIGRLDKDTSGIVIFAKSSEAAALLSTGKCSVEKTYYAVVEGHPGDGTVRLPIGSDPEVLGKMKADLTGKEAETEYETIAGSGDFSTVKVRIRNGRTHQIRVHLSAVGHPLMGDPMYGHGVRGKTHAMLHCGEVLLTHPFTGKKLALTAPFPSDWPESDAPGLTSLLLAWYDKERRILPWREDPAPYHIWVSEIMLQQTRVETVIPYYERFLAELPDVAALADAPEDRLMKLWEGLGYYSRVRNMQKAAKQIMEQHGGQIPSDPAALVRLSGIGPYTAAAIASIAFGIPVPSVDGNLLRVYARLNAYEEDIRTPAAKKLAEDAFTEILPKDRPGDMNQALMDLGATICLPNGRPLCESCPVAALCAAHQSGMEAQIPKAKEKSARSVRECTVLLIRSGDTVLLHKRPSKGLLAGLYEFPNPDGFLSEEEVRNLCASSGFIAEEIRTLPRAKHVFTHLVWEMIGYEIVLAAAGSSAKKEAGFSPLPFTGSVSSLPEDCSFIPVRTILQNAALPSAFSAYSALL